MKRQLLTSLALVSVAYGAPKPPKAVPVRPEESQEIPRAVPVTPAPSPGAPSTPAPAPNPPAPDSSTPPSPTSTQGTAPAFRTENPPAGESQPPTPKPSAAPAPTPPPLPVPVPATSPEEVQFELAQALFSREQWAPAAEEYLRFLKQYPNSPKAGEAYFRIAETHHKQGNTNSERLYYTKQLAISHNDRLAGIAAYRLAQLEYPEGDYAAALEHYKKAAELLEEPVVKQGAQFFTARCLQLLGRNQDARNAYQPLADAPKAHPYQEISQFYLALLQEEIGLISEALPRFTRLAAKAEKATIKAESATRSALLLLKQNDLKKALPALELAINTAGTEQWHNTLKLGVFQTNALLGNHQKAIDAFPAIEAQIETEQLPNILSLLADAHRQLQQFEPALSVYDKLIAAAPDSQPAKSARYDRLRCLYKLDRPQLPEEIDAFLSTNPAPVDRDNALLMKAEVLRSKGNFAAAGEAYAVALKSKDLDPKRRSAALLRWAECADQTRNNAHLVEAVTQFLALDPNHALAPTVLYWRAEAHNRAKTFPAAEKDYRAIVEKYPKAEERHNALLQLAKLRGQQDDNKSMADLFEQLLKDYPETQSAAEAHHWIGWAALKAQNYKKATVHLSESRKLKPDEYFESDSRWLISCAFNLNDADGLWKHIEEYLPKAKAKVPDDILRWCATQFLEAKAPAKAEPVLALLSTSDEVKEADWLSLSKTRLHLAQFEGAIAAAEAYLKLVTQPSQIATGLLMKGRAELGRGAVVAAQKNIDETLRIQPDGYLNQEARVIAGDIQASKKEWEAAAKLYASVALITDNEEIAPSALEKAYRAYKEAGKTKEAADSLNRLQSRYPEYAREHLK